MKIRDLLNNKVIMILLDSEKSLFFYEYFGWARAAGVCEGRWWFTTSLSLYWWPNSHKVTNEGECAGVQWRMQNYEICYNLIIFSLSNCDMILGMNWMKMYNPIIFDFAESNKSSKLEGKKITLPGVKIFDKSTQIIEEDSTRAILLPLVSCTLYCLL